ncbi:MAG TPA: hypothetical protein VJN18_07315 [Polyangiaceae bacterium]|nr:hypothetical protein [Polyangiaceae bacterium]
MTSGRVLRLRFLAVLSGGMALAAVPLACNSVDGEKEDLRPSCSSGSPTVQCFAPGSTHFNFGNTPTPQPTPTPSPLRAHGRLTPGELGLIARAAKRDVIAPCAAALA